MIVIRLSFPHNGWFMKRLLLTIFFSAALTAAVNAQDATRIATVDVNRVFTEYKKAAELNARMVNDARQLEAEEQQVIAQFKRMDEEIGKLMKEAENPINNEAARNNAKAAANGRIQEYQKAQMVFSQRQRSMVETLQARRAENSRTILNELRPCVATVAREAGAQLVLNGDQAGAVVLYVDPSLDLTAKVVARLNAAYEAINGPTPQAAPKVEDRQLLPAPPAIVPAPVSAN